MYLSILSLSLTTGNSIAIITLVIVQLLSYDKHICALLFIISYDKLKST